MMFELLARAKSGEGVKSGPIGLAVILLLCVAAYFLFKSMSKHLKRVREGFPSDAPPSPETPTAEGDSAAPQRVTDPPPRSDSSP